MQGFIFGKGTDVPSYEALKKKRELADLLAQQATAQTPQNVGEGIAAIGRALAGRYLDKKIAPQEDAERSRVSEALTALLSGQGTGTPFTPGSPASVPPSGGTGDYGAAIAGIESGGNYGAQGPVTSSGDRAYGKYQVMGANIPDWTTQALGKSLTPEQFLADPQAQDATFNKIFGGYVDQYGPAGAASMWFSGDPTPDGDKDMLGTSDQSYVDKFMAAAAGGLPGPGGAMGGGPDMGKIAEIVQLMENPYMSEGQKTVANAIIEKMLGSQMTPYQAGQMGISLMNAQQDAAEASQPDAANYGLNLQYATGPDGKLHAYQVTDQGGIKEVELPDGGEWAPGVQQLNTGTAYVGVDKRTGAPVGDPTPIDVGGKAAQTVVGESAGKAAASLGDREVSVRNTVETIDRIAASPDLESVTGMLQGRLPARTQGQQDLNRDIAKLVEQTFPEAIAMLVGMGAMSNMEGQAARQSIADLSQARSGESFRAELGRLKALLLDKLEIARQKAATVTGGATPSPAGGIPQSAIDAGIDPSLWQFMTPEEQALWN